MSRRGSRGQGGQGPQGGGQGSQGSQGGQGSQGSRGQGSQGSRGQGSRESRRRAIEQAKAVEARRKRRVRLAIAGSVVAVAGLAAGITAATVGGGSPASGSPGAGSTASAGGSSLAALSTLGSLRPAPAAGALGPEGVPVPSAAPLVGAASSATGHAVDGISCDTSEQTLFHIHAHLTIFVNGVARQVPAAIGIPGAVAQQTSAGPFIGSGTCFYWLHTHAADGIVHIESPVQRTYTLGDFFDEWGQPLGPDQVGPAKGHVTVIYNGKAFEGNPRSVPLTAHAQIQLEVGTPLIAPESINWTGTGL
jgi:hypothetical protein